MDMFEHHEKICKYSTGSLESNIRVKNVLSAALSTSFLWNKRSLVGWECGMKTGQVCINILFRHHGWTSGRGMQVCSFLFLSRESESEAQKTKFGSRCQEHYGGVATVWCACKVGGNFTAPAVTVGWEYWSSYYMDLLLQRTWGGVAACEWELNGLGMTLCMVTEDVKDYLI